MSASTDENGVYLVNLPAGHYIIRFEHPDYETLIVEADVIHNKLTTVNVELKRKKGTLGGQVTDEESAKPISNVTVATIKT